MPLLAGERLGRYEILRPLGAGGMGEVYRATDTTLGRDVAIKVLPDGVARDRSRLDRFKLEARAVAALSHPNILEIHDFSEQDGLHYAVTELLEGTTLRERIPGSGLPWQRVVEIGAAIADALAAAHGKGIVHRDLKPGNVFITSTGRVKVLDFGLARVQEAAPETMSREAPTGILFETHTQTGAILGTVGYLAPEMVSDGLTDARSDIFSLGCVLYEMATGHPAFRRATTAESLAATLRDEPPLPSSLGVALPVELERSVVRCLEKSPEARFQSAADLAFALRAIASGSSPASALGSETTTASRSRRRAALAAGGALIVAAALMAVLVVPRLRAPTGETRVALDPNRVVVFPFDNRTGEEGNDVIGLLVADWLTQGMPEAGGLNVIASSSAVAAARLGSGGSADLLDVAKQLGAGTMVTGAYYRQGGLLQIKAEIVATASGDLLNAVDPVSGSISEPMPVIEALRQRVLGMLAGRDPYISRFTPPTFEAYREFMAGYEVFIDQPAVGLEHFRKASELDTDFLPPRLWSVFALMMLGRGDEVRTLLNELDARRQELGPFELVSLDGIRLYFEGRYVEALPILRDLVARDPLNPNLRSGHAQVAIWTNHPGEAVTTLEALEWPQHDFHRLFMLSTALHMLSRHEHELEVARDAVTDFPRQRDLVVCVVRALAALGRTDEVAELVESSFGASEPERLWLAAEASLELRAHGRSQAAREIAERTLAMSSSSQNQDVSTLTALARLMLLADRPEEARTLSAELASSSPDDVELVGMAGAVAARLGDHQEAVAVSRRLEVLANPRWLGRDSYWRACIAAGLGNRDKAVELLRATLRERYRFDLTFHCNPFLEPLRGFEPFEEFLRPKG